MPTAKKRRPAKKSTAKPQKRPAKKRKSPSVRVSQQVNSAMALVLRARVQLRRSLWEFNRLKPSAQNRIYDKMVAIADSLSDMVDDYWDALPEESKESEKPEPLFDPLPPMPGLIAHLLGRQKYQDPEWPEVIEIEPEPPKEEGD